MLRMSLSEEARVRHARYHHPHPRVRRKLEAVLLKAAGLPHQQIASIVGVSENTLRSYLEAYAGRGLAGLTELGRRASWRHTRMSWRRTSAPIPAPPWPRPARRSRRSPGSGAARPR